VRLSGAVSTTGGQLGVKIPPPVTSCDPNAIAFAYAARAVWIFGVSQLDNETILFVAQVHHLFSNAKGDVINQLFFFNF